MCLESQGHGNSGSNICRLPDVVGVGCRRCGTSWLHQVLSEHPLVGKPPRGIHFFSENFSKGIDWYTQKLRAYNNQQILLEFSVSYTYPQFYKESALRIYSTVPEAKIILAVRNPVDRVFSDYLRSLRMLEISKHTTFEQAIEENPDFLERGLYGKLLKPFYSLFGKGRILVLFFEDLEENPNLYLDQLMKFLEIETGIDLKNAEKREHIGRLVFCQSLSRVVFSTKTMIDDWAKRIGCDKFWRVFKAKHVDFYGWLLSLNEKDAKMRPDTRKRLQNYYRGDIRKLEMLTGRDLKRWYGNL